MADARFRPQEVVWEITFACNMRCIHCGTSAGKQRVNELTTQESLALIDELMDLGCEHFTLSGGEPLMRKDWPQLASRMTSRGAIVSLITNGLLVNDKTLDDLKASGVEGTGVSLDGCEKTHNYIRQRADSWAKAHEALRLFVDRGFETCAVTQVSNINIDELYDIRAQLVDLGCKLWRIQMTTSTGRMREHANLILSLDNYPRLVDIILDMQQMGKVFVDVGENIGYYGCKGTQLRKDGIYAGCYAGTRVAGIESDGKVKGCLSMPEEYVEGNIRDSSFTEIWNRPNAFAYNRQFTKMTAEGECRECRYLVLCRGGCANTSIAATGKRADNPYCMYRIERAQGIDHEDPDYICAAFDRVHQLLGIKEGMTQGE